MSNLSLAGSKEVSLSISRSEVTGNGVRRVRLICSSDEFSEMGKNAKGPGFYQASSAEQGCSSLPVKEE